MIDEETIRAREAQVRQQAEDAAAKTPALAETMLVVAATLRWVLDE